MKKYLFLYAVAVTALLVCGYGRYRRKAPSPPAIRPMTRSNGTP